MQTTRTGFAGLSPIVARLVLAVFLAITVLLLVLALQTDVTELPPVDPNRHGDLETYANVVTRLQHGEPYYQALHAELLSGGYGTTSIFNWRPPFYLTLVSWFPNEIWASLALGVLAVAAAAMAIVLVRREGTRAMALGIVLLLGLSLLSVLVPHAVLACELAAGSLTLLSVSAYGLKLRWLGMATAMLALLCREIAGVYVLVCVVLAVRERRWREVAVWGVALAAFALYFAWHAHTAMSLLGPADRAYKDGWLQLGGAAFLLGASTFNGIFLVLPGWATALFLPLALLGILGSPVASMRRIGLTLLGYFVLFAFFGKAVNLYWGGLYTPLLAFGGVWAIPALVDLARQAGGRRLAA
ncbi:MAG: hypothetical protein ABI398_11430 [Devosia sp.]